MITQGEVIDLAREAIYLIIICSAPVLIVSLVVGLIVSILQTMTSIQEQTLTFVPKIIAVFVTIVLCGNWIMTNISDFFIEICNNFGVYLS